MNSFLFLKYVHILAVAVSFALFFVRGIWVMRALPTVHEFWARHLPMVVDGLLLLSGFALLSMSKNAGFESWMLVKYGLLVVYAGCAVFALRIAKGLVQRMLWWAGALLAFLFMTTVAVLHSPLGIFSII
ncbi:MAG: SirB2 family protein [Betaproteobacteria bacterium]